jgi:LPS-assembly protein
VTNTYGSSRPLGYFLKTDIIARFDPSFKLGMMFDYYSHRGVLCGPIIAYDVKRPLMDFKGDFTWGYIRDRGRVDRRGVDILQKPIPYYRYFLEWGHKQSFLDSRRLKLTSSLSYWRDSEVMKDFRPERFLTSQNPDTFEELVYKKENLFITGFTRLQPNNFQSIIKRAPEVTFEVLPTPLLNTAVFHNFKGSCAVVKERGDATTPFPKSYRRLDTYYGLYRSVQLKDFLSIMPVTGLRLTNYTHTRNNTSGFTGDASVGRAQVGFDLVGRAFSVWDYKSETWKIDGIRHIVKPAIQYRYIFAGKSGSGLIPPIDYRVFRSHLEPLDLGVQRNIDTDQQLHKVRFELQNYFQTKSKKYGAKSLAELSFAQDVCLHRRNNEERLSSFFTTGSLTPVDWLKFSASHNYHFKTHAYGLDTTTTITEVDAWAFTLGTTYKVNKDRRITSSSRPRKPINQVSVAWNYKFTERYKFGVAANYDARIGQLLSHSYNLSSMVGNHWAVNYSLQLARRGRYNHEATFLVNIQCVF